MRGKRKFTVAVLVWLGLTVGVLAGKVSGGQYVTGVLGVTALYGGANVINNRIGGPRGTRPE